MHITDIRNMVLSGPDAHGVGGATRTWSIVVVRVDTDAGIYGLGEALHYVGVRPAIDRIRDMIAGRDPLAVRPIVTDVLYGGLPPHVPGGSMNDVPQGPIVWAMSGIEMALCDIAGKALGTPAYNLFGGAYRDRVTIYLDRSGPANQDDLNAWKALAEDVRQSGFTHMKLDVDYTAPELTPDPWNRHISAPQLNRIVERLRAAREAVGPDFEIAVDCHRQYNVATAVRLAFELAPLKPQWLEDPTPFINPDAAAEVRAKSPVPICLGEDFIAEQFRLFIDRGACDIIHPDVLFTGGLHEARTIADYADLHYIPMAMHGNGGALSTVAGAHVAAASPNFLALEYHFYNAPWLGSYVDRGGPLFSDGALLLGDAPGLGVELNPAICRQYFVEGDTLF